MKKILIIDDDARNIYALRLVLKARGFEVLTAVDAPAGIQILKEGGGINVVLMDMMMPEMDGYEALSILRNDPELAEVPVIAVTAQAMVGDREKCLAAGANGYVSKPIDVDILLELLAQQ
ncbi:MAG: response regulator receiver protein [Bacteroidetes bacterium]|uniref:response regulator n=1 Tax=unclassified Chitinophaga TaxID=2619133 RepID=UPI0009CDF781|nr:MULTISPECIES: response regulator [unclassified Chitinophaga]MBP1651269.1 response regulator receiver protein [Bacteroidota bacterium]OMP79943.1 response regulator [[Flexibacter] sp. ATCC 35208]WPV64115.1 response regulator [Chitinophaga sp. LS1]